MTDTAAAPLEQRLGMWPDGLRGQVLRGLPDQLQRDLSQAADALAKARDVIIQRQFNGYNTVTDDLFCTDCGSIAQTNIHKPNCPIGAALEAMK
jgi:hypothetical protein